MDKQEYEKVYQQLPYVGIIGDADDLKRITLVKVLLQLPQSVREFALSRCLFVAMPLHVTGVTYEAFLLEQALSNPRHFYLIVIHDYGFKKEFVIAHEIAHAYMKEQRSYPENVEAEADKLAAEWGFPKSDKEGERKKRKRK